MSRRSNRSVAKESMDLAEVAIGLAMYQAAGNSIDNFDWNISFDRTESNLDHPDAVSMSGEIDQ